MNGKGSFPAPINQDQKPEVSDVKSISTSKIKSTAKVSNNLISEEKDIERIVIFYKDGTFKNFEQS